MIGRLQSADLIPFEFIEAVDAGNLSYDEVSCYDRNKRLRFFGKDLELSELGCLLSHRKVYESIVSRRMPCALVLEDDVHFAPNSREVIAKLFSMDFQWDLIRFIYKEKFDSKSKFIVREICGESNLVLTPYTPGGAYATLVSLRAAERLLSLTSESWLQADVLHGRTWETRLNTFYAFPSPFRPDLDIDSTIGKSRFKRKLEKGKSFPFFRLKYRIEDSMGKRLCFLLAMLKHLLTKPLN